MNTGLYPIRRIGHLYRITSRRYRACLPSCTASAAPRYRRRVRVLLAWLAALVVLGGWPAGWVASSTRSSPCPGTESQTALDSLSRTFPQAGGTTAQVVVVAAGGHERARAPRGKKAINASVKRLRDRSTEVDCATSPFDKYAKGVISDDNSAAIIQLRLMHQATVDPDATFDGDRRRDRALQDAIPGSQASIGGDGLQRQRARAQPHRGPRRGDRPDRAVRSPSVAARRRDAADHRAARRRSRPWR